MSRFHGEQSAASGMEDKTSPVDKSWHSPKLLLADILDKLELTNCGDTEQNQPTEERKNDCTTVHKTENAVKKNRLLEFYYYYYY